LIARNPDRINRHLDASPAALVAIRRCLAGTTAVALPDTVAP
jgi:hypothetical protein